MDEEKPKKKVALEPLLSVILIVSIAFSFVTFLTLDNKIADLERGFIELQKDILRYQSDASIKTRSSTQNHANSFFDIEGPIELSQIVAELDFGHQKSGCHPNYPIDFYVIDTKGSKNLIYDDFHVCSPGGAIFKDGPIESNGTMFQVKKIRSAGGTDLGWEISHSSGDAGIVWSDILFISKDNPKNYMQLSYGSSSYDDFTPTATFHYPDKKFVMKFVPKAGEREGCDDGANEGILVNEEFVDFRYTGCTYDTDEQETEQVIYTSSFDSITPLNESFTKIMFTVGGGAIEAFIDLENPKESLRIVSLG